MVLMAAVPGSDDGQSGMEMESAWTSESRISPAVVVVAAVVRAVTGGGAGRIGGQVRGALISLRPLSPRSRSRALSMRKRSGRWVLVQVQRRWLRSWLS